MASTNFIPTREADLVTWGNTFAAGLATLATQVGVSPSQVTTFTGLNSAWVNLYNTANAEATRTKPVLLNKDVAKAAMVKNARVLAGIIQKFPGTTNAMRSTLGLTVPAERRPIPVPAMMPVLEVTKVSGNLVTIRTHADDSLRRSKPAGVASMTVLSYVGPTPSSNPSDYKFEGATTRTSFQVQFSSTLAPFARVWLTAFYSNARGQNGEMCTPIGTNVGSWTLGTDSGELKIAA